MTKIMTKGQKKPSPWIFFAHSVFSKILFCPNREPQIFTTLLQKQAKKKKHFYVMCSFYLIVFKEGVLVWVQNLGPLNRQK